MRYSGECMECGLGTNWDGRRPTEVPVCPRCGSGPGVWLVEKYDRRADRWLPIDPFSMMQAAAKAARS